MTREEWETERVLAHMWWCGDEYCNCFLPIIERITPNHVLGFPCIKREFIWEGSFISQPSTEDYAQMAEELRQACLEHGVPVPEEYAT